MNDNNTTARNAAASTALKVLLFVASIPSRIVEANRQRAAYEHLWQFSDRELADIGITRGDIADVVKGRYQRPAATTAAPRIVPAENVEAQETKAAA